MKPTYLYTALGDSITEGYSATGKKGYVDRLTHRLTASGYNTCTCNVAYKGMTSRYLYNQLRYSRTIQIRIRDSSLVTLCIGGNDLLSAFFRQFLWRDPLAISQALSNYRYWLKKICEWIQSQTVAALFILNLYNPFPHSPLAVTGVKGINGIISYVSQTSRIPVIDLYHLFLGSEYKYIHGYHTGLLSDIRLFNNPVHPNDQGHQQIARLLFAKIRGIKN
ncbi:hypothetical protein GXN76_06710 [Kroppenstedtia pulmonis]|uniref:SGNH hydrolase-type esterase domain-containing protein n=1 Tax=Kroppenstedtia pulmonis TaxID=1380685 RepID=A0A7D4BH37_9BACL|nr:GDSL-type esterase/lipase family protein [Kroppenstedtia pulmonis]QKG84195.1 hypothetical protein GXN76_06710 [Kroppenstedtia pulmonis]